MKKIILHMGMHKTGSSSIQDTLYKNTKILKKHDMKVIKKWPNNNSMPMYNIFANNPYNYHINISNNTNKKDVDTYIKKNLKILTDYLNNNGTLIISGEDIRFLNEDSLVNLKKYLINNCKDIIDLNIIMYIRNPITYLSSAYQERIKNGNYLDINSISLKTIYNNFKIITSVFGIDNITLKSFEGTLQNKNGVTDDFLKEIGINNTKNIKYIKSNESISWMAFDLIKYINFYQPIIINNTKNKIRNNNDTRYIKKIRGEKANIDWSKNKYDFNSLSDELYFIKDNYNIDYTEILNNKININIINKEINSDILEDIIRAYRMSNRFIKNKIIEFFKENIDNYKYINKDIKIALKTLIFKNNNNIIDIRKSNSNILYSINDLNISRINMIENLEKNNKIKFTSQGNDPFFVLGNTFTNKTLSLFVKLHVPNDTIFQVFYATKNIKFSQNTVISKNINKGINHFLLQISNSEEIIKLRIDPGNISGEYIIEELNIFI